MFDVSDPRLPLCDLSNLCRDVKPRVGQGKFGARWKSRVELFQPRLEALELLARQLPPTVSAKVLNAEIAFDVPCPSKKAARKLLVAFLGAARMRSQRHPVVRDRTTWYYGRRATSPNSRRQGPVRRPHVMAAYADRPSKLLNRVSSNTAFHVEWRASGSAALADVGIVTISDLVSFDHLQFWEQNVRMCEVPKRTELGRILAAARGQSPTVSGAALRKRAATWERKANHHGLFVMHNALLGQPYVAKRLKSLHWMAWWREALREVAS
jgi:hypothetical protein